MSSAMKMSVMIKHNPHYKRFTNCDFHIGTHFPPLCITPKYHKVNSALGVSFTLNLSLIDWKKNSFSLGHVQK